MLAALPADEITAQIFAAPILIIEDNEINRIFLERTLRKRGYLNLHCAASAEEGLRQLHKVRPELVILDIVMPGMDGFECCAEIRKQTEYRDLPILIQTVITEPELRVKAFNKGATDFVSKPVYPDELCARVRVHLEKRVSYKQLQQYKDRVEIELGSARQLQLSILPDADEVAAMKWHGGLDIASYFQPSSEIGGDFWGMKKLSAHQTAFWLVDFSGHGVASALNSFRLQAYLNEPSAMRDSPGHYLSHLNDKLIGLLARGQFATMFYGVIDSVERQLNYACACAPNPMIMQSGAAKAMVLDGTGVPLGVCMQNYPTQNIGFGPDDTLLLYSDALIETQDPEGHYIRESKIMDLLRAHSGGSAEEMRRQVIDYFKRHAAGTVSDDLTLVVVKYSGR